MITAFFLVTAISIAVLIYLCIRYFVRTSERFGGAQVIICPETEKQAMVEVDARHAGLTAIIGQPDIRLESCWRWPLKEDCGQECLLQLQVAPAECLVRGVLMKWYRGKKCAFCERPFTEIELFDHKPALLNPDGVTVEWTSIPFAAANHAMATCLPVCWDCHIAQAFRREHPDLVVERSFIRQPSCSRSSAIR
jgi:hypothetical protein